MPDAAPAVRLVTLGTLAIDAAQFGVHPVWLAAGRLAAATAIDTLTVVRLEPGLPVVASTPFPGGMRLPDSPFDPYELDFDRIGIHGAALRPDGAAFAIGGVTEDHDRVVSVFTIEGEVIASVAAVDASRFGISEDFMVCPIALAWGGGGESLLMACSIENEHHVLELDVADGLAVTGLVNLGGDFPEPAVVVALAHPTEPAAIFQIACGQDGVWLRAVRRSEDGLARIPTAADEDVSNTALFGFTPDRGDGAALCTGEGMYHRGVSSSLCTRAWPDLEPGANAELGGFCHDGVVLGERVAAVVADDTLPYDRWPRPEQRLVMLRACDGAALGEAPFPVGHELVAGSDDCIVTREGDRLTVWRVEIG